MNDLLHWFEAHPGLAGYVQTLGSFVALIVAIGMPIWQRRSMERAAELTFGGVLVECYSALSCVACLVADDEPEFDAPGSPPAPADIARSITRAVARLDSVSLFDFNRKCAVLIQKLQREMAEAAGYVQAYVEGADEGISLDLYDHGQDERVYRTMQELLAAMRAFRDRGLSAALRAQLDYIDQRRAAEPRIKRVRARQTNGSALAEVWRSIWLRLSLRQAT